MEPCSQINPVLRLATELKNACCQNPIWHQILLAGGEVGQQRWCGIESARKARKQRVHPTSATVSKSGSGLNARLLMWSLPKCQMCCVPSTLPDAAL